MKQIDLEPHEYTRRDPRTGKMIREPSKTFLAVMTLLGVAMVAILFWRRAELDADIAFKVAAMVPFFTGILGANWYRAIHWGNPNEPSKYSMMAWTIIGAITIGLLFLLRYGLSIDMLFAATTAASCLTGAAAAYWLRDIY